MRMLSRTSSGGRPIPLAPDEATILHRYGSCSRAHIFFMWYCAVMCVAVALSFVYVSVSVGVGAELW